MNYSGIINCSIVDGLGFRTTLFISGCKHCCEGCHNPDGWSFDNGTEFSVYTVAEIMDELAKPQIKGLSILGGEPFDQPDLYHLVNLVRLAKEHYPEKDIWIWTGYEFEQIKSSPLIRYCDVAVTGRFILDQRDISSNNVYRGSKNQRVIAVKASLESDKAVAVGGIPNNTL